MASLGVVVPAYRPDVDRLGSYVTALDERLAPARILIELDAPRPGVVEALKGGPASVSVSSSRRGKGRAIAAGFDRLVADGVVETALRSDGGSGGEPDGERNTDDRGAAGEKRDVLAFFDADASTPPKSAAAVVAPVVAGDSDVAVGSRRHPEAAVGRHQTLGRRRLGDAFAWCARRLVEPALCDYQCGAKALSAAVWTEVRGHLHESGFGWDLELVVLADALGHEIEEVPITWRDRPRSTVPPARTAFVLARSLYRARRRARRLDSRSRSVPGSPDLDGEPGKRDGKRRFEERNARR